MSLRTSPFLIVSLLLLAACKPQNEVSKVTIKSGEFAKFPKIMQEFPVWRPISTPLYDFETRDGARRPAGTMQYDTGLSAADIFSRFRDQAEELGCNSETSLSNGVGFTCANDPNRSLELHLEQNGDKTHVVVLFLQTTPEFESTTF